MEALKNWAEIRFTQNSYDMLYLQDVFSIENGTTNYQICFQIFPTRPKVFFFEFQY